MTVLLGAQRLTVTVDEHSIEVVDDGTGPPADDAGRRRGPKTRAEDAGRPFLSEGTVRNYPSSSIDKTGARNRMEALRTAEDNGCL